jgi:tetratricopeptide (TPR) repeat protein
MVPQEIDSAIVRRNSIAALVQEGAIDERVVAQLVRQGLAIGDEAVLWDFKRELPVPPAQKINQAMSEKYDLAFSEIVKDSASFYNTFGGYMLAGVDDITRKVIGFDKPFDSADLNKRIQGATGSNIETVYRVITFQIGDKTYALGLLFIPKRPEKFRPAQFKKTAPKSETGKVAYNQNDIYFRQLDSCKPAVTSEELEFVFGPRETDLSVSLPKVIENNLPSRDVDLSQFIGRDRELRELWFWLSDNFSPVRIVSGLGGVGKTSLVYTFAERLIYHSHAGIDRVIWLGAKPETWSGSKGSFIKSSRVDFTDITEALKQLLMESGCPPEQMPESPSLDELLRLGVEHLATFNYLIVLDNLDSLSDADQQLLLYLMVQLCSASKTKALITARRNLGATTTILTYLSGLTKEDFSKFINDKCRQFKLSVDVKTLEQTVTALYDASNGSPLFALSILRLVSLGDSIKDAIANWKGADGEAVRNAAFQREIGRLKGNEARVFLVLSYLERGSVDEISGILKLNRYEVQNALETLQGFSMTTTESALPGGAIFQIPSTLALVSDLLQARVADWKKIKSRCQSHVEIAQNRGVFVGTAIQRTISRLSTGDIDGAREIVDEALANLPSNPDLNCLDAKVFADAGDIARAEESFRKAYDLGCRRREIFDGWIDVLRRREDWREMVRVAAIAEERLQSCQFQLLRDKALMSLGDQAARSGDFVKAEQEYRRALDNIQIATRQYSFRADRAQLWQLNETLVVRWLGVVRMVWPPDGGGLRQYFNACLNAIIKYRSSNGQIVHTAIVSGNEWIEKLRRRGVTPSSANHTKMFAEKLDRVINATKARPFSRKNGFAGSEEGLAKLRDKLSKVISDTN